MFHHIGGVRDHTGQDYAVVGELNVLPYGPLVFVAYVCGLEGEVAGVYFQGDVDDLLEGNVGGVRAVPGAPAQVETHLIGVDAFEGVVDGF